MRKTAFLLRPFLNTMSQISLVIMDTLDDWREFCAKNNCEIVIITTRSTRQQSCEDIRFWKAQHLDDKWNFKTTQKRHSTTWRKVFSPPFGDKTLAWCQMNCRFVDPTKKWQLTGSELLEYLKLLRMPRILQRKWKILSRNFSF